MVAPALCASPIKGTRMRIIKEDACGIPVTGAGSQVVTKGFVQVALTQQYEDGTEYQLRNAQGEFCVNETGPDQFRRVDANIQFCAIDPDVVNLITGSTVITTGAPATGTGFWVAEGSVTQKFSLEVWQGVANQACGATGLPYYVYWAFPHLSAGRFNDFTISDAALEWSLSAKSSIASPLWGTGPGAAPDWISAVPTGAHFGFNIAALPLPAETGCGAVTLS
jgi:hypothetical protein